VLCLGQPSAEVALRSAAKRAGRFPEIHYRPESMTAVGGCFRECLVEVVRVLESLTTDGAERQAPDRLEFTR
jgi:hypothetical protein